MSTATKFITRHRVFPFCLETVDISLLDPDDQDTGVFIVRGLTLDDATALYWNLESMDIAWDISGVQAGFGPTYTVAESVSESLDGTGGGVIEPNLRVCGETAENLFGSFTAINAESFDDGINPPTFGDVVGGYDFLGLSALTVWPIVNAVFIDENGDYCFCFSINSGNACTTFIGSGGHVGAWANNLNYIDVSVLSGTLRVYGIITGDGLPYVSGGSLDSVTITPNFYTY